MAKIINLSVHDIVDVLLRTGSIDNRVFNSQTMEEGSKVHRNFQGAQDESYDSEHFLETLYTDGDIILDIDGRADGLIKTKTGYIIDEIKSTVSDLQEFKDANYGWHQGQAKMYAWMFCRENNVSEIGVRVTYIKQHKESEHLVFEEKFTFKQLDDFAKGLLTDYIADIRLQDAHVTKRDASLRNIDFPFEKWRPGQKDLFAFSSRIASTSAIGYAEAPTGIGKTVCALMPTLESMGKEDGPEKVYYLTSKNSIRLQALKTAKILMSKGAYFRTIALTAKEKICLNDPELKKHCNPQECPFACNYYDKLPEVLRKAFASKLMFDKEDVTQLAEEFTVCPFELQMDMAEFCDLVICDYNYIYDPVVSCNRDHEKKPYALLVDEAHNLPSRAREMYSAVLDYGQIKHVREQLPQKHFRRISKLLDQILVSLDEFSGQIIEELKDGDAPNGENIEVNNFPSHLARALTNLVNCDELPNPGKVKPVYMDMIGELKAEIRQLLKLPYTGAPNYCVYATLDGDKIEALHVQCLDASQEVKDVTSLFKSALFFSATLSPTTYYVQLLGGDGQHPENVLNLPSPFDPERKLVLVQPHISTFYSDRGNTLYALVRSLNAMVKSHVGNYFFFFPSFDYMEKVYELFKNSPYHILKQERQMDIEARDAFLKEFRPNSFETTLGFVAMGGIFGEGIELAKNALQGVAVVSVGLPSINFINKKLSSFYESKKLKGFDYAFTYPGFNKVVQASGRVIRDDSDSGVILLIDTRFSRPQYQKLISQSLGSATKVRSSEQIEKECKAFWGKIDKLDGGTN